jgi:phage baseplate assembly protein W
MSANAVTLAQIHSIDWSLKLGEIGKVVEGLADVSQCIGIILTTPQGSDPLRPTFGVDLWRYVDVPLDLAAPSIVREVTEAITRWEPRVQVLAVSVTPATDNSARLAVTLTWRLRIGTSSAQTQISSVAIAPAPIAA